MKELLTTFIDFLHIVIALFLATGGYLLPTKYLPIFILCLPYLVIDWNDKDGLCWVTKLTNMIKYRDINPEVEDDTENSFTRKVLKKLGITVNDKTLTFLLYIIFTTSWFYAYNRLMNKYKIKIFPDDMTRYISYTSVMLWLIITYI